MESIPSEALINDYRGFGNIEETTDWWINLPTDGSTNRLTKKVLLRRHWNWAADHWRFYLVGLFITALRSDLLRVRAFSWLRQSLFLGWRTEKHSRHRFYERNDVKRKRIPFRGRKALPGGGEEEDEEERRRRKRRRRRRKRRRKIRRSRRRTRRSVGGQHNF